MSRYVKPTEEMRSMFFQARRPGSINKLSNSPHDHRVQVTAVMTCPRKERVVIRLATLGLTAYTMKGDRLYTVTWRQAQVHVDECELHVHGSRDKHFIFVLTTAGRLTLLSYARKHKLSVKGVDEGSLAISPMHVNLECATEEAVHGISDEIPESCDASDSLQSVDKPRLQRKPGSPTISCSPEKSRSPANPPLSEDSCLATNLRSPEKSSLSKKSKDYAPSCSNDAASETTSISPKDAESNKICNPVERDPQFTTPEDIELLKSENFTARKYHFSNSRSMILTLDDIARLNEGLYLNDQLITFFLKHAEQELKQRDPDAARHVHIFSTFLYSEIRSDESAAKWTAKLDLREKRLLFMPIHRYQHWSLAVIINLCNAAESKPAIIVLLDSLPPTVASQGAIRRVCSILARIQRVKGVKPLTFFEFRRVIAKVPAQENTSDCGVYLVHYVEQILKQPRRFVETLESLEGRRWDDPSFWAAEELVDRRKTMKQQIKNVGEPVEEYQGGSYSDAEDIEVVSTSKCVHR